jgi:hypothetical protein
MSKLKAITVAAACGVLAACGNPNDPSDSNFKKAVQQYLDDQFPLCVIHETKFPTEPLMMDFHNHKAIYSDLVAQGLMTKKDVSMPGIFKGAPDRVGPSFDLTAEGKKYYKAVDEHTLGKVPGLCVGKAKVNEIVNFTAPSNLFGNTVSEVKFTYTVTDLPAWASTPSLLAEERDLSKIVKANGGPVDGKVTLVLTGKGWMESYLFSRNK